MSRDENRGPRGDGVPRVRLYLLGGFRAERAGQVVPESAWERRTAKRLVALLATEPGHRMHREQIEDLLWHDRNGGAAYESFRKALQVARRALEPELPAKGASSYLQVTEEVVSLVSDHVWIDVDHFEGLAQQARGTADTAAYEAALAAYSGDLLPAERYHDWAARRRDALVRLRLQLLLDLAGLLERRGTYAGAIERLRQVLEREPAEEAAHRRLMRLYALSGNRHLALRQYRTCGQILHRELDTQPGPETQALYEQILAGGLRPIDSAGPAAEEGGRGRLPAAIHRLPSTSLIGRERSVDLLLAELHRATEGHGGTMLVSGEAGVGKSRLVAEVARQAAKRGALALWGVCYEREGVLPYGPFVGALDDYLMSGPPSARGALAVEYPELGRLIPSLRRGPPPEAVPATTEAERTRLFAAVVRLLTELSTLRPLLLVADDLHAADPATIQLLSHLAQSAPHRSWLVVGAYREEDVPDHSEFRQAAGRIVREGLCQHVDLLRLARPDCDRLVRSLLEGGTVEPGVLERLYRLSLGNPLFTQELVRAMQAGGTLALVDGRWRAAAQTVARVPRGVRDLVGMRVDRMEGEARQTLNLAAVAGMESSFAVLREASELPEGALLDALDRALEGGILEERAAGYAFRHPLFRSALYERITQPRRSYLHTAVATALERIGPEEVEALAYHYARSRDRDKALEYLERAGERAYAGYANEVAEGHYREAIALLPEVGRRLDDVHLRERQAGLRLRLGEVLTSEGRYDEALPELEWSAQAYQAGGNRELLAATTAQLGQVHFLRGTAEEGVSRVRPLLDQLEEGDGVGVPPASIAALHLALAQLYSATGRFAEELAAAERAGALAGDEDTLLAEAAVRRALALLQLCRPEDAQRVLEEILPLAEQLGNLEVLQRVLALLAATCDELGTFRRGRAYRQRALAVAERTGNPALIASSLSNLGGIVQVLGHWTEARSYFERSVEIYRSLPSSSYYAAYPLAGLSSLSWHAGDLEAGWAYADEALAIAERVGNLMAASFAHASLAELELLAGQPEAACGRLESFLSRPGVGDAHFVTDLLPGLARAHLAQGDWERADELSARSVSSARTNNNHQALSAGLRVRGMVLTRQGRWEEAQRSFEEALAVARAMPLPRDEAHALYEYGRMDALQGRTEQERERLQAALALFQQLGAHLDAQRTEQALAAL